MVKGVQCIGPTSLGAASTSEVQIGAADWIVPAGTRMIYGVQYMHAIPGLPTTMEGAWAKGRIYSKDLKIEPCEFIVTPTGSALSTVADPHGDRALYLPLNIPCKGGESIKFYANSLTANTVAAYCAVTVYFGTDGGTGAQKHYAVGTVTATGTATASVAKGTAYKISNARKITAAYAVIHGPTTVVAGKGYTGMFEMTSGDYKVPYSIQFAAEPSPGILGGTGTQRERITVVEIDVPCNETTWIQDYFTLSLSVTTAGSYLTGVQFE